MWLVKITGVCFEVAFGTPLLSQPSSSLFLLHLPPPSSSSTFLQIFIEFCAGGAMDDIIVGEWHAVRCTL